VRVVFVSPVGVVGGAERVALDLIAALKAADPAFDLSLVAAAPGPLLEQAEAAGARGVLVPIPDRLARTGDTGLSPRKLAGLAGAAVAGAGYVRRLAAALRGLRPDVVHSNGVKAHLLTAAAKPRAAKLVWHLHDFLAPRPTAGRALGLAARVRRPDAAVAISRAVAADANVVLPRVPVTVVSNGIDTDHYRPGPGDGPALDRLAGLPPAPTGTVRVGLVATYARWKGQDVFLEAAARTADLPVRWFVVGGPVYRTGGSQFSPDELRDLAAKLGVADRVGFVPFQPDPADVYRSLDVVVHASTKPEPFGLTIVEAMACGRAVVVSEAGGAAELFAPGEEAVGVPPGDADGLAAAVRVLAGDPDRRAALGAAARRRAVADHDRRRMGNQVAELYRALTPTS
jgi:glycosyltransferase involved in cell wall biosynthesis